MRSVHEVVPGGHVALARVLLHLHADDSALGVEHREAGADLVGEREQVQLGAELAVVAALGLCEPLLVRDELLLRGPCRAVDALQLGVLL